MVSVTGNCFPASDSVPLAVASIVSGFELSSGNARALKTLSKAINSKKPMAYFSFFKIEVLICDISLPPSLRVWFSFTFMHSGRQLLCQNFLGDEKTWKCLAELEMRRLPGGLRKSGAMRNCQRVGISSI